MKWTIDKRLLDNPWVIGVALVVTLFLLGREVVRLVGELTPMAMPAPLPEGAQPTPVTRVEEWVTHDDYPAAAIRGEQQGSVRFRVGIDEAGRARLCEIVETSGFAALDDAACNAMMRSARFEPFLDQDGVPRAFSFTRRVVWRLPEAPAS